MKVFYPTLVSQDNPPSTNEPTTTEKVEPNEGIFKEAFESIQNELSSVITFMNKAIDNPTLFFTEFKHHFSTPHNIFYLSISRHGKDTDYPTVHELQEFIGKRLNDVLQDWLKKHEIELNSYIKVKTPLSFPSHYALYVNETIIYEFNLFNQAFTNTNRHSHKTEEEILQYGKLEENRILKNIKETKEEIQLCHNLNQNPFKHCRTFTDLMWVLFKKTDLMNRIEQKIEALEGVVQHYEKELEKHRNRLPEIMKLNKEKEKHSEILKPFFLDVGFRYEPKYLNVTYGRD